MLYILRNYTAEASLKAPVTLKFWNIPINSLDYADIKHIQAVEYEFTNPRANQIL